MATEERKEVMTPKGVTLYRCKCAYCGVAEERLSRLCQQYATQLNIRRLEENPALAKDVAWTAPLVYINGRLVSRYGIGQTRWEAELRTHVKGASL